ncbi:MAG TPA: DNA helicase RecQ [Gemmataceae bacterium]|nr:DNA helicase RecQ [Gemmataceae bacterium]
MPDAGPRHSLAALQEVIVRHWGFRTLRPLQEQSMEAVLAGRDSLVVLPTGGGKSLCYQAPAVLRGDTTVVVSPLISLMKDQVDALRDCGVPAVQLDSLQTADERSAHEQDVLRGAVRLLFVSPERLVLTDFYQLLRRIQVKTFAIDEAHCISHWGHDFRPEYRQLSRLKEHFPGASIHAYTATATERVRRDVIEQLRLVNPAILVGNFDRPNLTYRVLQRNDLMKQVLDVIDRHPREAGIIYCIRRSEVDDLAAELRSHGLRALPYHAGKEGSERKAAQDAFAQERCDIIVATVAFGMGIDRSNIRFVLHTAMPKSVEHYQQETGRAGRDGLEAECVLLYSPGDFMSWKRMLEKGANDPGADASHLPIVLQHLGDLDRYCRGAVCRHRALVEYFGQRYAAPSCGACDICLGDTEFVADAQVVAQKILSCVARVKEKFGIGHVVSVLRGENTESVRKWNHQQLTTYGLLSDHPKADVRNWIYQLIGQGALAQEDVTLASGKAVQILKLNDASWEVMRQQRQVRLLQPVRRKKGEKAERARIDTDTWEGVDQELFEALRGLRLQVAEERRLPAYIIFHDGVLRQLARVRPSSLERMRLVSGIGDAKLKDLGPRVLAVIDEHCRARGLARDTPAAALSASPVTATARPPSAERRLAWDLFRQGTAIDEVVRQTGRSRGTIVQYLVELIGRERPNLAPWIAPGLYERITAAIRQAGSDRLKPIFITLGEQVPYDDIRLVRAHLQAGTEVKPEK